MTMKRVSIYTGIILSGFIGGVLLAITMVNLIPADQYKSALIKGVNAATGHELTIEGNLDIELTTTFTFEASGIRFSNAVWGTSPTMLSIDSLAGELALFPLLKGILDLSLVVNRTDLLLETDSTGEGNWEYGDLARATVAALKAAAEIAGTGGWFPVRPLIRRIHINSTKITFRDGKQGDQIDVFTERLHVDSTDEGLNLDVKGTYNDALARFSGNIDNYSDFFVDNQQARVNIEGHLGDIRLTIKGTAGPMTPTFDIDLNVALEADSLALLESETKTKLPQFGPLKAIASVQSKTDTHGLDIKASLTGKNLRAVVNGAIKGPVNQKDISARVNLHLDHFTWLTDYGKMKLPPIGPLTASANIVSTGSSIAASDISLDLAGEKMRIQAAGSVQDLFKMTGINATLEGSVDSLASLAPLLDRKLPVSGPVTLQGKIAAEHGVKAPVQVAVVMKSDGIQADLEGHVAEPLAVRGVDLEVSVKAESLKQVGRLVGVAIKSITPVTVAGRFKTDGSTSELSNLRAQAGNLEVTSQAVFKRPSGLDGRPHISGRLHLGAVDLSQRQAIAEKKKGAASLPGKKVTAPQKVKVFSSRALPFELLKSIDADIEVTAEGLRTLRLQLEDLKARVLLENGRLDLKPINVKVGSGSLSTAVTLDTSQSPAIISADVDMVNASFPNVSGKIKVVADLKGSGNSIADLMAGLNGQLVIKVSDASMLNTGLARFGADLLDSLNPFREGAENTHLNCAVVLFDVKDGIADAKKKIALQTNDATWFGSGKMNLKTEAIEFGLFPVPRKGLGLDLGRMFTLMYIGGTLSKPKLVPDATGMAIEYGHHIAAVGTAGLSLVARKWWDKRKANKDVCAEILKLLKARDKAAITPSK